MVRIYVTEQQAKLAQLLAKLVAEHTVSGLTVIAGRAGLGTRLILDPERLASPDDPPLIIEFFERQSRALAAAERICELVAARHVVSWPVDVLHVRR